MKKILRITGFVLLSLIVIALVTGFIGYTRMSNKAKDRYAKLGGEAKVEVEDGVQFRDLNKNGRLDVYEDSRAPLNDRLDDLIGQMTLEEKAGTMFITMIGMTPNGDPIDKPLIPSGPIDMMFMMGMPTGAEMLVDKKMNSFNILHAHSPEVLATFNNNMQKFAERSRLGIPVTIASDPRHGNENNPGAAIFAPIYSQWPSTLGLAATRDTLLVREFADIARQEYLATGIRLALHPVADLATEPRWGRIAGTFGEDANLSAQMTKAYVLGFQGDSLGAQSVACMTKHFSGGGPQENGEDAHFVYGKNQVYPGNNFDYHLIPFEKGAFPARTAQIMPYYGIPVDQTDENVAFAFNKTIITTLLREKYGFDGVICTDWNIINKSGISEARAWGLEDLTPVQRTKKVLDAGCDQFGGESSPELVIELVKSGQLKEARIDQSVRRILRDKFVLGLFDDPYIDEEKAGEVTGKKEFRQKGEIAQAKSAVLLKNEGILPLEKGIKIYVEGVVHPEDFADYAEVVDDPDQADVVVKRVLTPYEARSDNFLERFFHQGRLYYTEDELEDIISSIQGRSSVIIANLERPAILTPIDEVCSAMIAEFGVSDKVLAKLLFGEERPQGKLPFELPRSQEAVENQKEDLPYDSKDPLYPFGHGLSYESNVVSFNTK